MKIRDVETLMLQGRGQQGAYGAPYGLLVRVTTDEGLVGYGETDSMPSVVKAVVEAPYLNELMSGLKALLVGEDPLEIERLWRRMARGTTNIARDGVTLEAMAAVDLALWDIKGKALEQPVCRLLGPVHRDRVKVYASHPLGRDLGETARFAAALRDRGMPAVKFGWHPLGPDAEADEAIVRTLRQAIGEEAELLIDGGNAWDAETAIERCKRFEPYRLFWLEEPLPPYDTAQYRRLTSAVETRIAAGELAASRAELARLIAESGIGVVQVDVSRVGLTEAMRVAAVAQEHGVVCVNHTYGYDLNLAASLHFVAALPETSLFEYQATPNEIRDSLVRDRPRPVDGLLAVPQAPGLGVEIDEAALARFVVHA